MDRKYVIGGLVDLYLRKYGQIPQIKEITGGGSPRKYFRLSASGLENVVGVYGEDAVENITFIRLATCFSKAGLDVPEVLAQSDDGHFYLEEDLGDKSLFECLNDNNRVYYAKQALSQLVNLQSLPSDIWDKEVAFPPFSNRLVRWDLNYFKYDFLKPCGIIFDEDILEDDFNLMTQLLVHIPQSLLGFMYRDFQSRNIMVKDDKLWLIDFQGGRKGPVVYDAVSFLWQARAPFTFDEREELGRFYSRLTADARGLDPEEVEEWILPLALFRTLQVFGAYGFRGLIERKQHFIDSIPGAQRNLKYLLEHGALDGYEELQKIAHQIISIKFIEEETPDRLTLKVYSFSYKKGYPEDRSGNGGGFMFDCRGIHNPGRYEEFKHLTGRDEPVIRFLEERGEADKFVETSILMVKPTIERYLDRGFTSLQVGFGCTGGQHRSVFCAEKFAAKVKRDFPGINIELIHREQK